jgi:hypothetical protein
MTDPHEHLRDMSRAVPGELISFGRALSDAEFLNDGWAYFLSRAEKWSSEYALWLDAGRPHEGDGRQWDVFCDQLVALEPYA